MRNIKCLILLLLFMACSQKKAATVGETPFQVKLNNTYKDASKSPLKAKDLKN